MKKIQSVMLAFAGALMLLLCQAAPSFADNAAHFSAVGGTYTPGATIPVTVYEDSGSTPVNVVQFELLYDPARLQFINVDPSAAGMTDAYPITANGNSLALARYRVSPLLGKVAVATVNFKVLADNGATDISFGPNSAIFLGSSNIWDGTTTGATYTIAAPNPVVTTPPRTAPKPSQAPNASTPIATQPVSQPSTLGAKTTASNTESDNPEQKTASSTPLSTVDTVTVQTASTATGQHTGLVYTVAATLLLGFMVSLRLYHKTQLAKQASK